MTDAKDKLISLLEVGGITSKEEFYAAVDAAFADEPPVQNTINTLMEDDTDYNPDMICVWPLENGKWAVYVPPTQPSMFESFNDDGTGFDPTAEPLEPWGVSEFDTLMGAVAWLSIAVKQGNVVFNDGRVAQ